MEPAHKISRRIISLIAYLAMALALAYVLLHRYAPTLALSAKAPLEDKILTLGGSLVPLSSLKKPVLINFFATWCEPCQREMPALSRLAQKYRERITFVGAAVNSSKADILSMKSSIGLSYVIGQADEETVKHWQAQVLPTTYLINAAGNIVWAHAGVVSEEELERNIAALLKK